MNESIAEVAEILRGEHATPVEVEERTIRVLEPVVGDPGITVLRLLGLAQADSPVGAAARSDSAVAVGVWHDPELYVARWLNGRRWVVGYRLTGASRLTDYVRTEGHVPTRLETGHWYDAAPDTVKEKFFDAGLLLDDPPFPVLPPPPKATSRSPRSPITASVPPRPRRTAAAAAAAAKASGAAAKAKAPATRLCPECRMHKVPSQFEAGSDYCVDCR